MWYAVWVRTGQEEKVRQICERLIRDKEICEECFLPKYEKYRKVNGKGTLQRELLFPGYLFFVSENPDALKEALRGMPEVVKVLGDDDGPIALYPNEVEFLRKYTNEEKVVEMSSGYILGDRLVVTDGPFEGYDGNVVHIDRHKRKAVLEVEFFGRRMEITVGMEVVRKE